jgi:N-methylhydantoinase B
MTPTLDITTLKIAWERLTAAVDEAGVALMRAAFSTIIRESQDFSFCLFDRRGRSIAQSNASIPSFLGTMPPTMQHFLRFRAASAWQPGDVAMTNDPWMGTGHLPDVCIARPVFVRDRLVGFAGAVGHVSDIGGRILSADAAELYEEGLRLPPCMAYRGGVPDPVIHDILRANVRVADVVIGDIEGLVAGCHVIEQRVADVLRDMRLSGLDDLADAIHERSAEAAARALESVPAGTYHDVVMMDGKDEPLRIEVTITADASGLHVDYTGTAAQVPWGINSVLTYTRAYTLYPLKCALMPELPNNEGTFSRITVTAPEGSLLNPRPPAPVGGRNVTGHYLSAAVFGALGNAMPARILADSGAPRPILAVRGRTAAGRDFSTIIFLMGGMGAGASADGNSCLAFPTNTSYAPVEVLEQTLPIHVERKSFREGSGGLGRFRGGLGQTYEIKLLSPEPALVSLIGDRMHSAPRGFFGGASGAPTRARLASGRELRSKEVFQWAPGDTLVIDTPGGGGYGDIAERVPELMARDVADQLIVDGHKRHLP